MVPRVFPDAEIEKACSALVQKLKQFREFELDMMAQNEANVLQPMLQARQRLSTGHEVDAGEGGKYTTNRSRNGRQHFIKFAVTLLRQGDIALNEVYEQYFKDPERLGQGYPQGFTHRNITKKKLLEMMKSNNDFSSVRAPAMHTQEPMSTEQWKSVTKDDATMGNTTSAATTGDVVKSIDSEKVLSAAAAAGTAAAKTLKRLEGLEHFKEFALSRLRVRYVKQQELISEYNKNPERIAREYPVAASYFYGAPSISMTKLAALVNSKSNRPDSDLDNEIVSSQAAEKSFTHPQISSAAGGGGGISGGIAAAFGSANDSTSKPPGVDGRRRPCRRLAAAEKACRIENKVEIEVLHFIKFSVSILRQRPNMTKEKLCTEYDRDPERMTKNYCKGWTHFTNRRINMQKIMDMTMKENPFSLDVDPEAVERPALQQLSSTRVGAVGALPNLPGSINDAHKEEPDAESAAAAAKAAKEVAESDAATQVDSDARGGGRLVEDAPQAELRSAVIPPPPQLSPNSGFMTELAGSFNPIPSYVIAGGGISGGGGGTAAAMEEDGNASYQWLLKGQRRTATLSVNAVQSPPSAEPDATQQSDGGAVGVEPEDDFDQEQSFTPDPDYSESGSVATLSLREILQGRLICTLDEAGLRRQGHEISLLTQQASSQVCQTAGSSALQDHILETADKYPGRNALKPKVIKEVQQLSPGIRRFQNMLSSTEVAPVSSSYLSAKLSAAPIPPPTQSQQDCDGTGIRNDQQAESFKSLHSSSVGGDGISGGGNDTSAALGSTTYSVGGGSGSGTSSVLESTVEAEDTAAAVADALVTTQRTGGGDGGGCISAAIAFGSAGTNADDDACTASAAWGRHVSSMPGRCMSSLVPGGSCEHGFDGCFVGGGSVVDEPREDSVSMAQRIINMVNKVSGGGATLNQVGMSGSISASGIVEIDKRCPVKGMNVYDLGAGCGIFLMIANVLGAAAATGSELPENMSISALVFEAALKQLPEINRLAVNINYTNILDLKNLLQAQYIFSFWNGHDIKVRNHSITLVATCSTAVFFVCTTARGESPERVLSMLNQKSLKNEWILRETLTVSVLGGNMRTTCFIFSRMAYSALCSEISEDRFLAAPSDLMRAVTLANGNKQRDFRQNCKNKESCYGQLWTIGQALALRGFRVMACVEEGVFRVMRKGKELNISITGMEEEMRTVDLEAAAAAAAGGDVSTGKGYEHTMEQYEAFCREVYDSDNSSKSELDEVAPIPLENYRQFQQNLRVGDKCLWYDSLETGSQWQVQIVKLSGDVATVKYVGRKGEFSVSRSTLSYSDQVFERFYMGMCFYLF